MILIDVNILVYAYRADSPNHQAYASWLEEVVNGDAAYGLSDVVLSGFLRVVTHPRVFTPPSPVKDALIFANQIRGQSHCVAIRPREQHWDLFCRLCEGVEAKGNLIPDAYLAALAIESGCEWITTDRDFSRFPGLRWRHPLT